MTVSEARLAEVAEHLDGRWLDRATNLELVELMGAGSLEETAKSWIAGEIRWAPDSSGGRIDEEAAARIRRRVRLRVLLDLPRKDCASRRPAWSGRWCACLTLALDAVPEGETPTKAAILKAARRLHRPRPGPKKVAPSDKVVGDGDGAGPPPQHHREAAPATKLDPVTQTTTGSLPTPRYRRELTGREWRSKGSQSDSILDKEF